MLAIGLGGLNLPHEYGGPVRLFVPFLQGYKSVKWLSGIHAYRHDPAGIKRLLGQSKTGRLGQAWLTRLGIEQAAGRPVRASGLGAPNLVVPRHHREEPLQQRWRGVGLAGEIGRAHV